MTEQITLEIKSMLRAIRKGSDIMFINILSQVYYNGFDDGIRIGERTKHPINNIEVFKHEFSNKKIE